MKKNTINRILSTAIALTLCVPIGLCTGISAYADTSASDYAAVESYANSSFAANTYYYDRLNSAQQAVYNQLDAACLNFMSSTVNHSTAAFDIVRFDELTEDEVTQTFWTFWYSNPQYHFLATPLMYRTDCIVLVSYDYYRNDSTDTAANIRSSINSQFDAAAAEFIKSLDSTMGDVEKEKAIIEAVSNITYSDAAEAKSVYGALLGSGCNSVGYAMTMNYFCNLAELPCITLVNDNNEAWNMVQLNGDWYLVDVASYISTKNDAWLNNSSEGFAALDTSGGHNIAAAMSMFNGITLPECTKTDPSDDVYTKPVITSAVGGEGAIDIEWTPVANATNYRIFTILNGKFTKVGDTSNTSYTITGLKGSTTYGILVRSYANGVWSDFTEADYATAKTNGEVYTKPVITSAVGGDGTIDIEWTSVEYAVNYRIFTILNGKFTKIGDTANTSYTITGLNDSTTYGILVRSYANGAWSAYTEADYATAKTNGEVYTKPVITSAVGGDGKIDIEWTPVENAANYRIFTILNGKFTKIGDTANTAYTITGLKDSTTYGILVRSYANGAWSAYSEADYATAKTNGEVYTKPVITSAVGGDGTIDIEWTAVDNASVYRIFIIVNGQFTKIGDTSNTSYTITGLENSTPYGVLVRSYANGAWSEYSSADYATVVL